jgi:hypothetical protein
VTVVLDERHVMVPVIHDPALELPEAIQRFIGIKPKPLEKVKRLFTSDSCGKELMGLRRILPDDRDAVDVLEGDRPCAPVDPGCDLSG